MEQILESSYIKELVENESVLGIILVGSSSRPYKDMMSDYDLEVIVTDEYYRALSHEEKFHEIPEEELEFLFIPLSEFVAKRKLIMDVEHWPYQHFKIISDRYGLMEQHGNQIISMDEDVRIKRIHLHYFEFVFCAKRLEKLLIRANLLNCNLVCSKMNMALIKMLFLLYKRWPPVLHWASENLNELDIPESITAKMIELSKCPNSFIAKRLIVDVDELLTQQNFDFHFTKNKLTAMLFSPEYRKVRDTYGTL